MFMIWWCISMSSSPNSISFFILIFFLGHPDPAGMKTLLRLIYAVRKYPHTHILSISTSKNQSMKVCGALYVPTYGTNTNLSHDVTQYYKNITSSIGVNARIQRDIQLWIV